MSQQGGQPRLFLDQASGQYCWHDQRTNEYVYQDGSRRPVPRLSTLTTPRTGGNQQIPASQYELSTSSTRDPNYGQQYPQQSRPQPPQAGAGLTAAMSSLTIGSPSSRTYDRGGVRVVEAENLQSRVRTTIGTSPASAITDPTLYNAGVRAHRMLYGSGEGEGSAEALYSNYRIRRHEFFTLGRVFMVLWVEPAGEAGSVVTSSVPSDQAFSTGAFNERVFSKTRRFVVIREGANYCSALPIATYGGRGVSKSGVKKSEHAIIYTGRDAPQPRVHEQPQRGEAGMRPISIRVTPDDQAEALDPMSRLDFGKVHTVQHNIKVRPFGNVHPDYKSALYAQFQNVFTDTAPATGSQAGQSSRTSASASPSTRRARPPRSSASGGPRHYTTEPVAEESDESGSGEDEDEEEDDEEEEEREVSSNTRGHTRPSQGVRAPSTAQPRRTGDSSNTAPQAALSPRQQWARSSVNRLIGQGHTQTQAFGWIVDQIKAEGKSPRDADTEARALLSTRNP